ncbi:hypothetical protein SAMN04488238_10266 [Roseicitreum antarcticum]|uniref:DUF6969 domain-containing protein n=2 Tax=Roseicitreum antarcticum TaxID=564137 RepID=A0A1H2TI25_9RHOB|nr:hypothetical protein SAMN04488238_10266 [Roseicitreum antarcticum]
MPAAGEEIRECIRVLRKVNLNLIGKVLKGQGQFVRLTHFPQGDAYSRETPSKYYCFARREDEHRPFHLFLRAKGMTLGYAPVLDATGRDWPAVDHVWPSWPTNRWLTTMVRLLRPQIATLVRARDEALAARRAGHQDRDCEVLSETPIDVDAQIEAVPRLQRMSWMIRAFTAAFVVICGLAGSAIADPVAPISARYAQPTDRYAHNVLGDLRGFGALEVTIAGGTTLRLVLPEARVFEDIAPRLWDIDGDEIPEIVAVESDQSLGARLTAWAVLRETDGTHGMVLRAAGDFIGTRFRWLAPAGIADFTGDGRPEIAYVEMPHLARRLVLVGLRGDRFEPLARIGGVSNHRIGEGFITGGLRNCGTGPELLLPSADWSQIARVTFDNNRLVAADLGPFTSALALEAMMGC